MKRQKIEVEKREIVGKKVKNLRKSGLLPANIYGKGVKSTAVQVPVKEFEKLYKDVGETGLIDLAMDGQVQPVLIKNVQTNPLSDSYLHADFYQVNLKEKIKTMIPISILGEANAVSDKIGMVLQTLSEVEVEALPEDLPERIEVHVEHLAQVNDQITVSDLKVPKGVEILSEPSQVVVKITELVSEEAKEQAAAEAAAAEAAKAETAAEGAPAEEPTPVEGAEQPKAEEEKAQEAPKEENK